MESILPIQLEVIWTRYLLILRVVVKRVRVNLSDRWNLVRCWVVLIGPTVSTHAHTRRHTGINSFGDPPYRAVIR